MANANPNRPANRLRRLIRSPAVRNVLTEERPIAQIQIDQDQAIQDRILQEQIEETNRQRASEDKKAEEKKGKGKKLKGGNIRLSVIADEVYKKPSERGERDGWKYVSGDKRHGIWQRDGKAVVGIRGTQADIKDVADDAAIATGTLKLTPRYKRAKKWVKKAIKKYGKNNVEVAGHSLGGKIAKSLAKDFGIKGSTFNAGASVSDAVSSIGDRVACKVNKKGKRCKKAKKVENYRTAIDPVSAAAIGDINTTTVKRKPGSDPHAIKNFVPEEEQARETQEGEGFRDRMSDRYKFLKAIRLLRRHRIPLAQIASTPMHVRSFLGDALGGVENIPPDAPETFPSFISLMEYAVRQRDLRRGAEDMPGLEQAGEGCCGSRTGMCGTGRKRYEFTQVGGGRRTLMAVP